MPVFAKGGIATPSIRATLHLGALWAFAIAEPLYEILGRNRELFVAYRVSPLELLAFTCIVSIVCPLLLAALETAVAAIHKTAGDALHVVLTAVLFGVIVSEILVKTTDLGTVPHLLAALGAGAAAAWALRAAPLFGTFLTVLSPSVVVFPALFLLQPAMAPFLRPVDRTLDAAATLGVVRPPIVLVVFDQLPLTSLMADNDLLDARHYGGFAALAADATWYRNASTAAELTGWAIPPILTGLRPRPQAMPTAQDYPQNLFTLLNTDYHFEVNEPITNLCPPRLCGTDGEAAAPRMARLLMDASVVALYTMAPAPVAAQLPPVSHSWRNFARAPKWTERWVERRDDDRTRTPQAFIAGISSKDPQPTLYYLHALLPHEPYVYLPTGQRVSDDGSLYGLLRAGRWTTDEWPVVQAYRRHLLQVQYVDRLVGQLVSRLREEGLWDSALVIVTADHGACFRPGHSFKAIEPDNVADIMSVPLFVKAPQQRGGGVSDLNVQSIDVVPTIADLLDVDLPWHADGMSVLDEHRSGSSSKRIQHMGASRRLDIETADLARLRRSAVQRRLALFVDSDSDDLLPVAAVHRELVGQPLEGLSLLDEPGLDVQLNEATRYLAFDPGAAVLPVVLKGVVVDAKGAPANAELAIAVNGVIRATTLTYTYGGAPPGLWTALINPRYFTKGANRLEVFVIRSASSGIRLDSAFVLTSPGPSPPQSSGTDSPPHS